MANHSPKADNVGRKKTWEEAMAGAGAKPQPEQAKERTKRAADKGAAAKNGGGEKQ